MAAGLTLACGSLGPTWTERKLVAAALAAHPGSNARIFASYRRVLSVVQVFAKHGGKGFSIEHWREPAWKWMFPQKCMWSPKEKAWKWSAVTVSSVLLTSKLACLVNGSHIGWRSQHLISYAFVVILVEATPLQRCRSFGFFCSADPWPPLVISIRAECSGF